MAAPSSIPHLVAIALMLSPLAGEAAPGDQPVRAYSYRMETLFIRLDTNRDGRLDARELEGRRALIRRLKRQTNRSYLLLEDMRGSSGSPNGRRLKERFRRADRDRNRRLDRTEASSIPWIRQNFEALDRDRDQTVTLQELWGLQRSLAPRQRRP